MKVPGNRIVDVPYEDFQQDQYPVGLPIVEVFIRWCCYERRQETKEMGVQSIRTKGFVSVQVREDR